MTVLSGVHGALRYNGGFCAKVRSWTLNISREALDTSCLGAYDRTYVPGIRGATGNAEIMYDADDSITVELLNSILANETIPTGQVGFVLNTFEGKSLAAACFVTSVSPSVSTGAIQASSVTFQITGPITGGF